MALMHMKGVCSRKLAFRALLEVRETGPGAGERVNAMQCSSRGPASASSLPVKAARALSARSLESQTSCQAACSTSGLHLPLHFRYLRSLVFYRHRAAMTLILRDLGMQ